MEPLITWLQLFSLLTRTEKVQFSNPINFLERAICCQANVVATICFIYFLSLFQFLKIIGLKRKNSTERIPDKHVFLCIVTEIYLNKIKKSINNGQSNSCLIPVTCIYSFATVCIANRICILESTLLACTLGRQI